MTFTPDQIKQLDAPLSRDNVKKREGKYSYIEGWHAIAEANRIFGYGSWSRETVEMKCVSEREREIGQNKNPGWGVAYMARVRISVWGDATPSIMIMREGAGAGHGIDRDLGQAHESALKEAETDAMKRALMTFGNPFGLALYDKEQAGVEDAPKPTPAPSRPAQPPAKAPASDAPSAPDKNAEAKDWARRGIAKANTIKTGKEYDDWYTPAVMGAVKRLADIDPALHGELTDAISNALERINPISGG